MRSAGDNVEEDKKFKFLVNNFEGGMRRNVAPSKLADTEYALLINGRSRYGTIRPIKLPRNLTGEIPPGFYQGLYGVDSILVIFKDGKLWARDYAQPINAFAVDPGFQMSHQVDRIYAQPVPVSWMNIQRKASSTTDNAQPVTFQSSTAGTPQALVCQDGLIQPRLVFSLGSSRVAKTIEEWKNTEITDEDTREYVPIGKQMLYHDSIFYIVSPDGKEIYRSVTGRPLDFVVAIDQNGDKLPPLTSGKPEASRLSYAVSADPITCIKTIPSPQQTDSTLGTPFFAGTLKGSFAIFPNYLNTLFGEPTFSKNFLFDTGPLNQEAVTPLLGDTAFVTETGITSFNSVASLANEGKNAPFYNNVFKLFEGLIQDVTATITSDNYGFLAVKTIYGYGILVYDTLRESFESLDIYPEVSGPIKQFAEIKVFGRRRLFAITASQLFELFAGIQTANLSLYCREFEEQDTEVQLIPRRVRVILKDVEENGELTLTPFTDGLRGDTQTKTITKNYDTPTIPLQIPFGTSTVKTTVNKTFSIERGTKGHSLGILINMNFIGDLVEIMEVGEGEIRDVSDDEAGDLFNAAKKL